MLPHNLWDFDAASPPVLFDLPAGKTGWVYLLDRRSGRQVRRSDAFVPLENIFPIPTPLGTRSSPGTRGGANWPPPAYSPRTGMMYIRSLDIPTFGPLGTDVVDGCRLEDLDAEIGGDATLSTREPRRVQDRATLLADTALVRR